MDFSLFTFPFSLNIYSIAATRLFESAEDNCLTKDKRYSL